MFRVASAAALPSPVVAGNGRDNRDWEDAAEFQMLVFREHRVAGHIGSDDIAIVTFTMRQATSMPLCLGKLQESCAPE